MDIYFHNTLTGKKELFSPLKLGQASMYNCGPTVYDYAHIGNLRSYVFADVLRRTLELNGFEVKQVVNITDVGHLVSDSDEGEDKMTKALRREKKPLTLESMKEVGSFYADAFRNDLQELNIEMPSQMPRASEHISEDIEIVRALEEKGVAYRTSDGMYFDTSKFPGYGKLGNISYSNPAEGARVEANPEKKDPKDFALWKFDAKLGWESPWGKGFPGWHIECSAMSRKYLGQPFDIHTGGIDHIPVHHNNEIAQSEAAFNEPLAHYWLHNAFLNMGSAKMAKSAGSFLTLGSLKDQSISPLAYRYWLMTGHYRSPLSFSFEAVLGAQNALIKLIRTAGSYPDGGNVIDEYARRFNELINDDLNTPSALALAWDLIRDPDHTEANKKATLIHFDKIFGLKLDEAPKPEQEAIPDEISALAEAREEARKAKDWNKADALRKEIEARGYEIKDTEEGFRISSK